ncbi:ATP-binding protein [Streptomyces sp. NPDC005017]|uniref:ATP-binding protein n=1 Tax=Streptomyces sp. NPDC005017 TaxID=3364706 RepID=UPI0036CF7BD5
MWKCADGPDGPPACDARPGDLVGRDGETARLRELLAAHRLVTVTGPAGVGKSALARAVRAALSGGPGCRTVRVRPPGGATAPAGALAAELVRSLRTHLAPDGVRVPGTGAVRAPTPADVARALRAAARGGRTLILLDDVDPVHTECAGLVQRLLMDVPEARVLVTSRAALGLGEERVLRLAPLRTDARDSEDGRSPAVRLFLERARGGGPFDLSAVREVCRLLEGVPLAIELAAGQTGRHSVAELARLLRRHQCWLSGGRPGAPRRHRSLRSAIGSAYALHERPVRVVWARAAVFSGSFTEAAAVFLCAGGGVAPHQVPGALARLAAIGVLRTEGDPGAVHGPRYRMAAAARDFGRERLRAAGEFPVAVERLVTHARRVAEVAENLWGAGSQRQAVRLLAEEQDDLMAVARLALERPEHIPAALEAVVALWFWWVVYDHAEAGRDLLLTLLGRCEEDSPPAVRARWLAAWLTAPGDPHAARALLGRAWPAAVMAGDDAALGRIAHVQGMLALRDGDAVAAAAHFREAADTVPPHAPGGPSAAVSLAALAVAEAAFDPAAARRSARRALSHPDVREDTWACLLARYARAFVDHRHGRRGRAWHRARRALAALDTDLPAPLPAPHGRAALHGLIADIESGAAVRDRVPFVPTPRPARGWAIAKIGN